MNAMQSNAMECDTMKCKNCWLLTLHPPVSACWMVTCVAPCQCLTSLFDSIRKSRKMQLPAAEASGLRPKKCCLLTVYPPVSACRRVTCVTPCQRLAGCLSVGRSVGLSVCRFVRLSVCLSFCLSVCLPLFPAHSSPARSPSIRLGSADINVGS